MFAHAGSTRQRTPKHFLVLLRSYLGAQFVYGGVLGKKTGDRVEMGYSENISAGGQLGGGTCRLYARHGGATLLVCARFAEVCVAAVFSMMFWRRDHMNRCLQ